ncbi:hypothetical protein WJX75_003569 [Coccomyxa subellipsoidea]|uniref:Shugoshin C-terminal domain-containing protein n=1 Tax=Coccomyxa subellipsoidea TaxID=248742 RepID=A0ABR2Z2I6_9CHLO
MSFVETSMELSPEQPADVNTCTLDVEEMLGESLMDKKLLQQKEHLGHKAIKLLQRRAGMLTSTANLDLRKLHDDRTELERQLQGELATRHCQLMAAQVDVEVWKRRTGLLQLKLSSLQEDVDMYAMRTRLLEAEIREESAAKAHAQVGLAAAIGELEALKEQLLEMQGQEKALQATVEEYRASQQQLEARLAEAADKFEAAQKAAASEAQAAEQSLTKIQEELGAAKAQLREALQGAAAATERAEELEWRLKRQEATLAERLRLADEAKQATDGLSEEGLRAVQQKAAFLGEELRAQLAESREMLASERQLRRKAEAAAAESKAALKLRLEQASADVSALRQQGLEREARLRSLEESCRQQQTKAAMDVVTSLVGDLNPPDTEPRRRPSRRDSAVAENPRQLGPLPETDSLAAPPPQPGTSRAGDEAAEAGKEQEQPKKQKHGSKSKAAQAEQEAQKPVAAGSSAEAAQPTLKHIQEAASVGQAEGVKKSHARAAKKQAKAGDDAAEASPVETAAAAKAGKRADRASKKRKAEENSAVTDTSEQQGDESADDSAPGGRRARSGRARTSKAPYWMSGAGVAAADDVVDDRAPPGNDSSGGADPAAPEAHIDWEEAPKQAAKKQRHTPDQAQEVTEAAQHAKPKRARKKAQESAQLEDNPKEIEAAEEKEKPAAARKGRRKLVKAGQAAAEEEEARLSDKAEAAAEQPGNVAQAPGLLDKKGGQRRKGKAAVAAAQEAVQPQEDAAAADDAVIGEDAEMAEDTEQEGEPDLAAAPLQESSQGPAESEAEAKAAARQVAQWERSRPPGVSKVDLTTIWGHDKTPRADATSAAPAGVSADDEATGKEKENGEPPAAARHEVIKPMPGRSRFGSQSEANPLAALHPEVLAAAVKARGSYVSGLSAPNRGGDVAPGKRRLLPKPQPIGTVAALPRSMLFGQNFQIPKLSQ